MILKIILIILIAIIAVLIVLPFIFNIVGVQIFQFSSSGGGSGTLFSSQDGGKNWKNAVFTANIIDIVFHPLNSEIIWAGTKSAGLWKSENGSKSWKKISDTAGVLKERSDVFHIAVARSNPKILYLAVFQDKRGRILKSEDGGESFREIYFVTQDSFGVFDIYVSASDPDRVIIATGQGGVLESLDGGHTWRAIRWFGESVTRLAVNPVFANEIYVVTSGGRLWKTFNGGRNWSELNRGLEKIAVSSRQNNIAINPFSVFSGGRSLVGSFLPDPNIFTTVYVGSRIGLLRSPNGGFSWERLNLPLPPESLPVASAAIHPFNSSIIFAGAGKELYRSEDGGINWNVNTLPTKLKIHKIFIHPQKPEIMFLILGR